MTISYTTHERFPLLDTSSSNWGSVINGALEDMDAGRHFYLQAGENISQYQWVYLATDGKVYKAKADNIATMPAIGIAINAIASGNSGKVRWLGWIVNVGWALTVPGLVYLSATTAGTLTQVKPGNVQVLGRALTTTSIQIHPDVGRQLDILTTLAGNVVVTNGKVLYT